MSRKILIVEDDADIREVLTEAFSYHGYEPITANDAEEALKLVSPEIQVIFLDLKLPGEMDGLELCRKVLCGCRGLRRVVGGAEKR